MNEMQMALALVAITALYLTAVAWFAIYSDETLPPIQRAAQSIIAFVIPILGPITVLYFASPLPDSIGRLIPWPFRSFVAGKPMRKGVGNEEIINDENHFNL